MKNEKTKIGKYTIYCIIALLLCSLLLCFEDLAFLLPFIITTMSISVVGVIVLGIGWLLN